MGSNMNSETSNINSGHVNSIPYSNATTVTSKANIHPYQTPPIHHQYSSQSSNFRQIERKQSGSDTPILNPCPPNPMSLRSDYGKTGKLSSEIENDLDDINELDDYLYQETKIIHDKMKEKSRESGLKFITKEVSIYLSNIYQLK